MICTDCNGKKVYQPLIGPAVPCDLCGGSGVIPESGVQVVAPTFTVDTSDPPIPGIAILTPGVHTGVGPRHGQNCHEDLIFAQRWDAIQHGLVAGTWYRKLGSTMWSGTPSLGPSVAGRLVDYESQDWVCEFIGGGKNKYYKAGDADYMTALNRAAADPCYSLCRMFYLELDQNSRNRTNLLLDKFEHGQSAIDYLRSLGTHHPPMVILESHYDPAESIFKVRVK